MTFTFVSNYINHHQIPLCEALWHKLGNAFTFIQTMPMEEERVAMGWGVDVRTLPYVRCLYEAEYECRKKIVESDVVLFGWSEREDIAAARSCLREGDDASERTTVPGRTVEGSLSPWAAGQISGAHQISHPKCMYAVRRSLCGVRFPTDRGVSGQAVPVGILYKAADLQ